jgi:hypothetical protein
MSFFILYRISYLNTFRHGIGALSDTTILSALQLSWSFLQLLSISCLMSHMSEFLLRETSLHMSFSLTSNSR